MNVLFVASEMEPFVKIGGLADVIGTLPRKLAGLGCDVRVVIPYYRVVKTNLDKLGVEPEDTGDELIFCMDWLPYRGRVKKVEHQGVTVYLLENRELFDRSYIYSTPKGDYPDNDVRFGFLSLGALEAVKSLGYKPDIIHCHDWETSLIPICLKWRKHLKDDEFFNDSKIVFTIHNISYQGQYDRAMLDKFGLPGFLFTSQGLELYGKANLLKGGIIYSDLITTVSQTYAEEIKKREFGYGLDAVLKWISRNRDNLIGILNGIDYELWDPESDDSIYQKYGPGDVDTKAENKHRLREELALNTSVDKPLLGIVSKLTEQKGIDLVWESLSQILDLGYQVVIVGAGVEKYETSLRRAARRFRNNLSVTVAVNDDELERKVYAASDMFLMPPRFEPCGLGQLTALRYGSIPVVRGTGGLLDTVRDYSFDSEDGNGFVFDEFSTVSMLDALLRAISLYEKREEWNKLIVRAMSEDNSWRNSGKKYMKIYEKLLGRK